MRLDDAEKIIRELRGAGEDDYSLYEDYGGRGMGDRTTVGITGPCPVMIGWAAGAAGLEEPPPRSDSMGRGVICY